MSGKPYNASQDPSRDARLWGPSGRDRHMELHLKPELEARIARIAGETGRDAGGVIEELLETWLHYDDRVRRQLRKGLDEADRGLLPEHDDAVALVHRRLRASDSALRR